MRQVFRALARADHVEPAGLRPVDDFRRQGGLVAVSHGVDDACAARLFRQRGAGKNVRLDVDHDHMLARGDGGAGVSDAGMGVACRLHHHIDIVRRHCAGRVVGEIRRVDQRLRPADTATGGAGAVGAKVGDMRHFEAVGGRNLRQEHGAELTRADQADPDRAIVSDGGAKAILEKHERSLFLSAA